MSGKSPVQTAADGSYSFTGLASGDYRIQVTPPANLADGKDTAGQIGGSTRGTVTQDQIEVQLNSGENGTEYNFAMQGVPASLISLRLFLASTPPVSQLLPQLAASTTAKAAATVNLPVNSKPSRRGCRRVFRAAPVCATRFRPSVGTVSRLASESLRPSGHLLGVCGQS